ncbi:MAG TPA: hypothetical protein VMS22_14355 [Candidatus Eisenbacteria bacterium]|nr:hypothetical protein [Candidatus Eisenbacteria bacterium]
MVTRALALALTASSLCLRPALADPLQIQVTSVRAAESGPSDPQLVSLRPRLRRLVGYRAFQIVNQEVRTCDWRSEARFALPGGRHLQLLPKGADDDVVNMQVRLLEGRRRLVDTNVRVVSGGTMMFGVGRDPRIGDSALIILLKADMK